MRVVQSSVYQRLDGSACSQEGEFLALVMVIIYVDVVVRGEDLLLS
jgi:hypothetical protein